jgi:hypothetical protein
VAIIYHFFVFDFFICFTERRREEAEECCNFFDFFTVCVKKLTEGMASLSITGEEV